MTLDKQERKPYLTAHAWIDWPFADFVLESPIERQKLVGRAFRLHDGPILGKMCEVQLTPDRRTWRLRVHLDEAGVRWLQSASSRKYHPALLRYEEVPR